MSTAALAAVAAIGEKLRCEHTESRNRISIRGHSFADSEAVTTHDFFEHGIALRKPARKRNVDSVRSKRNLLHLDNEFDDRLMRVTSRVRHAHPTANTAALQILGSDTLTAHHTRLSYE
jgi:hypothetical protein